jgi:MarR family transcriptional regulator, organic hydroperoxide resistance regulator
MTARPPLPLTEAKTPNAHRSTVKKRRAAANGKAAVRRPAPRRGAAKRGAALPLTVSLPTLLEDGSDRQFRRLVHSLFGFLARHEAVRDGHAATIGLAGIEYTVLISIAHLSVGGNVAVKTVADHLHVTPAFVTTVAGRLLGNGLIRKESDPADRRRVCLTVAEKGYARLADLAPIQRQVNDAEFGCLSAQEFHQLIGLVERLIESGNRAVTLQRYLLAARQDRHGRGNGAAP